MWEPLIKHLSKYNALTDAETGIIQELFKLRRYRKRQYILQEGDVSRYTSFILEGLTRIFRVDEKGQEHVVQFGMEDSWVGDIDSFACKTPSNYNIDCIEDTLVLQISKEQLDLLYQKVPKIERHFRILVERALVSATNRMSAALSKNAAQRYAEFMQTYPGVTQRVHDHQIASYLGITPQSLSRIRSQMLVR
jgi:CRP-like cAMP-binding protein